MNLFKAFGLHKATSADSWEGDMPEKYSEAWWRKVDDIFEMAGQMGEDMTDDRVNELLEAIGFDTTIDDDYAKMERADRAVDQDHPMAQQITEQKLRERGKEMFETTEDIPPTGYTGMTGLPPAWNEQAGEVRKPRWEGDEDRGEKWRNRQDEASRIKNKNFIEKPWHRLPRKDEYDQAMGNMRHMMESTRKGSELTRAGGSDSPYPRTDPRRYDALDYVGEGNILDRLKLHEGHPENFKTVEHHIPTGDMDIKSRFDLSRRKPYIDPVSGVQYAWPDMQNMTKMDLFKVFGLKKASGTTDVSSQNPGGGSKVELGGGKHRPSSEKEDVHNPSEGTDPVTEEEEEGDNGNGE